MKVKVYSTKFCPFCVKAKDFLKQNKISFEEIDVGTNKTAAEEMIKKSGQLGVPVIEIDGKIIVGYDAEKLKAALKLK